MAEFKLGRIKFVYQGAWATGTAYAVDDVVTVGGKTYICVISHTSAGLFGTDLNFNPTKWNVVSDGSKWLGNWTNNTYYNIGDQVQYGGIVYQANTAHTSIATSAPLTVTGATGTGATVTITFTTQAVAPFLIGSTVTVAGITTTASGYNQAGATVTACTTTSVSYTNATSATYTTGGTIVGTIQTALEADQSKWDAFASNFFWGGSWTINTRYKVRDLVTYGGITYVCNTAHVSANTSALGLENDTAKWDSFNSGIVYLGAWSGSSYRYKLNDVVKYGADLWICTTQHTSSAGFDNTKWGIFVNGFQFESSWSGGSTYQIGDIVTYGGYAYICKQNHATTQTPSATSSAFWDVYTTGFSFQGDWSSSGNYYVGSVVRLGGYTYVAIADNTTRTPTINSTVVSTNFVNVDSVTGLIDSLPITVATTVGGLSNTSTYYVIGATVATTTATLNSASISNGSGGAGTVLAIGSVGAGTVAVGMYITGAGVTAGTYIVSGSALSWVVSASQLVAGPITLTATLNQFKVSATPGSATAVTLSTTSGQSVVATTNPTPPFATYWSRLNPGIRYNSTAGTYTAVSASNVLSSGVSATFNVTRNNSEYAVTVNAGGTGYASTDTLKILGTSVGGISPANDIFITVNTVSGGVIQAAGISTTGNAVTWTTGTAYVLGDAVYFGANSYICVSAHIGATGNRPDNDTTGTYWNLLSAGTNSAVLTTQGDTYYYGSTGAQRLPIGTDGQILRVTNGLPAWSYYGILNNIVYVAPSGTDSIGAGQGLTLDKPWKTVRFAAKQIEDGYLNTNARDLLAKNKQFILKEVSNYVSYIYQVSVTGTATGEFTTASTSGLRVGMPITFTAQTGSLTIGGASFVSTTVYYIQSITTNASFTVATSFGGNASTAAGTGTATAKYYTSLFSEIERDAGYIFEGVVFDLSHGGTSKSVINAKAYLNTSGSGYINAGAQSQAAVFVGADTYMSTLIGNVLANTAPTVNYQSLNSVATPATQIFDTTLVAESGSTATAQNLVAIVTSAITAGVSTNIPVPQQPQTSVSVKTGTFNEVLPIIIPSYTAIVGDELRSTVIQPQPAIANLVNDKPKSVAALGRVKALVSSLVANTPITGSAGNKQVLATTGASSSAGTSTVTFALQTTVPFVPGQKITISGVTPSGFNGSKTVTACTLNSVSFSGSTAGPQTVAGIASSQDTSITAGNTGSAIAVASVVANTDAMRDTLLNGTAQILAYSFTNPTGYNTSYLAGYGDGKTQIVQNYQFIKDEISAFLNTNYNAVWTALGGGGQALCQRDVGYMLDALQYDMTYGGNTQSQIAGSTYYSNYALTIAAVEKVATVAAYQRLQQVVQQIVLKTSVAVSAGNATSQVVSGTAGSASAATFAAQRIGDTIYWINNTAPDTGTFSTTGSISTTAGGTLTVTAVGSGVVVPGALVTGAGVGIGTYITAQNGGVSTVASATYSSGGAPTSQTFVVGTATNVAAGQLVVGTGVPAGSYVISSYVSGTTITLVNYWGAPAFLISQASGTYSFYAPGATGTYLVNVSQTVSSTTITGFDQITPVTSGAVGLASAALQASYNAVVARKTEIQADTVSWVARFYQSMFYNTATCYRDAGLIVDALAYDAALGSNFNSIIAARSYFRAISSAQVVINSQLAAEVGSIGFVAYKVGMIAGAGSVIQINTLIDDAIAYINGGSVPRFFTWPDYTGISADRAAAAKVIWRNKAFIQAEISSFLSTNYSSVWTSIVQATCTRDVGYIVDAIRYDLTYGGNYASKQAGIAYYSRLNASLQIGAYEKVATLAAYTLLGTLVSAIAQNGAYTPLQGTVSRVTASAYGTGTEGTAAAALVTIVYNYIDTGLTTGAPKITITTIAGTTTFTSGTHGLAVGDEVIPQSTANGLVAGTIYYVASIPLATTFTLAATWGGAAITTFTNGTGLSIVAEKTNNATTTWVASNLTTSYTALSAAKATLQASVISYITTNFPTLSYNSATCARDVGYLIDAVGYDFMVGSNFKTVKAAMSYYRSQSALVIASQKSATISAFQYLQTQLRITLSTDATALASMNANMTTYLAILNNGIGDTPEVHGTITYNNVQEIQQGAEILRANRKFLAYEASAFIDASYGGAVTATSSTGNTITFSANHNLTIGDPVQFTAVTTKVTSATTITSGGVLTVTAGGTSGMVTGMPVSLTGTTFGGVSNTSTYYIINVNAGSNQITLSASYNGSAISVSGGSGTMTVTAGGMIGGLALNTAYYVLTVPSTTTITVSATQINAVAITLTSGNGALTMNYYYLLENCLRDTRAYIDAMVYDLQYTGNYQTLRASELYVNAVRGSQTTDMFRVRNGTGLRNCTLNGLTGILTVPNIYGTSRPTAGAFVALDPGFGPNDTNVWVSTRSHYSQNVTMFGTACSGAKIDAALHSGGNKSMVKNDFTTIISDGIGVWCTGSGSLTELVSVFNYYGYAGYLAELGGRMRATNGNSSYGTYGVIAEGVDTYETPILANLNNRSAQALISNVVTDAVNLIYRLEFSNAGSNYTNTIPTISSSGYGITTVADEFRDAAVFETRIIDLNDTNGFGGTKYVTAANTAQLSSVGNIVLAATDTALSTAYTGMRIQITAGSGVGQFANILSFENGGKVAKIIKDSFAILTITATTNGTPSTVTVASTATLFATMPFYTASTVGGLTVGTLYFVQAISSATTFTVSATSGGTALTTAITTTTSTAASMTGSSIAAETLTVGTLASGVIYVGMTLTGTGVSANTYIVANISGSGTGSTWTVNNTQTVNSTTITGQIGMPLYAAGWDHVVAGWPINNVPDLTSTYILEPRINYTEPGYTATARALIGTGTWEAVAYGANRYVAVASGATTSNYSTDGRTWLAGGALPSSSTWQDIVYSGGQGSVATATLGGFGGQGAVLTAILGTGDLAGQVVGITINTGGTGYTTPPTIVFTAVSGGSGAVAVATVLNGAIASLTITIPGSGYNSGVTISVVTDRVTGITMNAWGKNYFSTPAVAFSTPAGISATVWSSGGTATLSSYYSFVNGSTTNYYLCTIAGTFTSSGPIHTSGTTTNGTATLQYFGTQASGTALLTNAGVSSITIVNSGIGYNSIPTVTITDSASRFVAIATGSNAIAYNAPTTITSAWSGSGVSSGKTDLLSIAYGAGLFIAVGGTTNTSSVVSTTDPISTGNWIDRSAATNVATATGFYTSIAYGSGVFLAVNGSGGNKTITCAGNPATWVIGGNLPASTNWTSVAYGNNRFVALAVNGAVAYTVNNGTTWFACPNSTGTTTSILSSSYTWSKISYGQGVFMAIAKGTTVCATSPDGINWTVRALPSSSNWQGLAFGNPSGNPLWVAVSDTSGTVAASIRTGAQTLGRIKVASNSVNEVRIAEPGSGYPKGTVTGATGGATDAILTGDTTNLASNQPVEFTGCSTAGLLDNVTYYVISATIVANTSFKVSATSGSSTPVNLTTASGLSGMYRAGPIVTQTDPNRIVTAALRVRLGDGAVANPSISARGTNNATASASVQGDGFSDLYQSSSFVSVSNLYSVPTAGANVQFANITGSNQWYKLVSVTITGGIVGNYQATFQINPALSVLLAPPHNDLITTRLKYSQVRLTGHDFLYIGTGNFTRTNYPNVDPTLAITANQGLFSGGGRVFFTSTDQDGNFNVGNLFGVAQATGTATLNASAFNLAGLQSLQLGAVTLGVGSAIITQFSTDPFFTANSDSVVPTQKAIKAYITAQIGGGSSTLNVNTLTAGQIKLSNNTIENTAGNAINVISKMNFIGGVDGAPVALAFFSQR